MKQLAVTAVALIFSVSFTIAQSKTVQKFHDKYKDNEDAKVVSLNHGLFELLASVASFDEDDEDAKVIARIADNITSMDLLAIPLYKSGFNNNDIVDMRSALKKENYEEMMTVRDGSDHVYFLTQGNQNEVKNMLVLISGDDEFMVMNINGTLNMKDLAYLAKNREKWD
ncbi:DUF4252 domain-containing protein [Fulvivirga ligni]|uniref:DUF4252 domain-containing protein n=1 Tax=Fulvivirga ligni TaxID=2904246 RepID=UPI001F34EFAA|nr:DUF4252 domain-containing protein [Fulvivirga ligni]UII23598.1 DUF4252 domain-containing protein [Fulvivirga ligni]